MRYAIFAVLIVGFLLFSSIGVGELNKKDNFQPLGDRLDPIWNKTWNGGRDDTACSVVVDTNNIYVSGYGRNSSGEYIGLLLKYDMNGNEIWNHTINATAYLGIAIDSTYIYTTGSTRRSGIQDILLEKYDLDGKYIWNKTWGGNLSKYNLYGYSIVKNNLNIYTVGFFNDTNSSDLDVFILKYDLDGNLIWNRTWGGNQNDRSYAVALDSTNIYVVGETESYSVGLTDAFILKYDFSGNQIWNKTWGGTKQDTAGSIVVDSTNLYVVGKTTGTVWDTFILKYDLDGNFIWNKTWDTGNIDVSFSVAKNNVNIFSVGYTTLGSYTSDAFILKYDTNGNLVWNKTWGINKGDEAIAITLDNTNLYVVGRTGEYSSDKMDVLVFKTDLDGGSGPPVFENVEIILPSITLIALFVIVRKLRK